jgi:hypothetical protein
MMYLKAPSMFLPYEHVDFTRRCCTKESVGRAEEESKSRFPAEAFPSKIQAGKIMKQALAQWRNVLRAPGSPN